MQPSFSGSCPAWVWMGLGKDVASSGIEAPLPFVCTCRGVRCEEGAERVELHDFVEAHYPSLLRTAFLLTGDHHAAEDLVQDVLARSWAYAQRTAVEQPGAFLRRCMVNQYLYAAAASSVVLSPTSLTATGPVDTIAALCAPLVEKGATTKACVPQQVNGATVQRSETDAPNTKIDTWANLRILYKRPDQLVVYTEVTIWNTGHPTTAAERAAAAMWLNAQTTKLVTAATTGP